MRRRSKRDGGRLGVILGEFPSTSETFILREMLALEAAGVDITPFAMRCPNEEPHADAKELAARTVYPPRIFAWRAVAGQVLAAARFPAGYASALLFVLRNSLKTPSAFRELAKSLSTAAAFAVSIRRRHRISHVHAQFGSQPATVGLLLAEILGLTFSMSVHARDIFTNESLLLGVKLAEAEFTAVCTRHGLERLQRQYPLSGATRLQLIYHGIDVSRFSLGQPPDDHPHIVLAVGRLVPKKGLDILLRAAAVSRSRGADFHVHIVGDGPEREDLERLAAGLGLREVTAFHGRLTQEELVPVYRRAYAFALGCVVTEDGDRDGIPNVLLEALALGIPAVATTTGGIPELIEHEVSGLLARPGDVHDLADQLERIVYDEELRRNVIQAGRAKVVSDFDVSRSTKGLAALLGKYVRVRGVTGAPEGEPRAAQAEVE